MRRTLLGLAVAALCAIEAHAQTFPSKSIHLIVGFPPGGGTDNLARAIAPKAGEALGQPVVVENNGGASGMLATQQVQRSVPDGYTLLLMTTGGHLLRPMLEKDVPFDPIKDFTPVTQINISVIAIAANPATGPKSFEDLIDRARRNPGKLAYGTAGLGTETHFMIENIGHLINGPMQVVPYKGGGPALNDLLGGQIPLVIQPVVTFLQHARAGKLRILAMILPKRWETLPEVPTVNEFIPKFQSPMGGGAVWGPAKLPQPIALRLQSAIASAINDPAVNERLRADGHILAASTPAVFAAELLRQKALFEQLLKEVNLKQ